MKIQLGNNSLHRKAAGILLVGACLLVFLSGCTGLYSLEQPEIHDWIALSEGQTIGQTFVANYDGLTGIFFYLSPLETGTGEIRLHLRASPQELDDLAFSLNTLPVAAVASPGYFAFFVPVEPSSNQKYYYAYLEVNGGGSVQLGKASGGSYSDGALYQNGKPQDAQAAFKISYSRRSAILGLAGEAGSWLGYLLIGSFLFILPGWGILGLLLPNWDHLTRGTKLGLSAGLSLALYPLLILWTDLIGLHLGALYAWLPPLAGVGMLLWKNRKRLNVNEIKQINLFKIAPLRISSLPDITFAILLVLIIFTRFWVIRNLIVPMNSDSIHHTMIAQLLVDHGGLFKSWQPYADLSTFTYHFGFHSAVAAFNWITHLEMNKALLWVGQIINILAVISLYPLAEKIGRSKWAGVVAVLVAGLQSPMPMYYINWGRYTQLAGQVILPLIIYLAWLMLEKIGQGIESPVHSESLFGKIQRRFPFDLRILILSWIALAGLALTHYRILIFAILFFPAFFLVQVSRNSWRVLIVGFISMGVGAGVLFLPWFIHVFAGRIMGIFARQMSTPPPASLSWSEQLNSIGGISSIMPDFLWILFFVGIIWGLWKREKGAIVAALWSFLLILAADPQWLHLPGRGALTDVSVLIAAYIPVSILIGYLAGQLVLSKLIAQKALGLLFFISIIAAGSLGIQPRLNNVVTGTDMVAESDLHAMEWIRDYTPTEARFLVNSYFYLGGSTLFGTDGGWWIPFLAGRQISLPPLTYAFEQGPRPDYIEWINDLPIEIQSKGITSSAVKSLLLERGISFVYIGQKHKVANPGSPYYIEPQLLLGDPDFRVVFHQDRVWVFQVLHAP